MTNDPVRFPEYVGVEKHELHRAIEKIAHAIKDSNSRAEFLFGAGMSISSKIPSGPALAKELLKRFFKHGGRSSPAKGKGSKEENKLAPLESKYPLEALAEALARTEDLAPCLEDILLKKVVLEYSAHNMFKSICSLESEVAVPRVFTTNFDDLIEKKIGDHKALAVDFENVDRLAHAKGADRFKMQVIHLHGVLDKKYIITESQIFDNNGSFMNSVFESALTNADAFCFVGYSMSDPDLRAVYHRHRTKILQRPKDHTGHNESTTYFIAPPDDEFDYAVGREIAKARGGIWIPLDALGFFTMIRRKLQGAYGVEAIEAVAQKFGFSDNDYNSIDEKAKRLARIMNVDKSDALQFMSATPKH